MDIKFVNIGYASPPCNRNIINQIPTANTVPKPVIHESPWVIGIEGMVRAAAALEACAVTALVALAVTVVVDPSQK